MANQKDLSEQLNIANKLQAVLERMAVAAERTEKSHESQVATLEKMALTLNQIDVGQAVEGINQLVKNSKDVERAMGQARGGSQLFGEEVTKLSKTLKKDLPKGAIIATAAISGLWQGFKNVVGVGKGFLGFLGSATSGIVSIAASIIAIPFKMFTGLVDFAAQAGGGMSELLQEMENIRKEFGSFAGPTSAAILTTGKTLKGFSDTGLSAYKVFGRLHEKLALVRELAVAMGPTFGLLTNEFEQNGGAILAFQKGLGITHEQMKGMAERAITMGKPLSKVLLEVTKQTTTLGKTFGISQKIIGKEMAKAANNVKHFGGMTVKEIGRAVVYANKLGLELENITGILDAFDTFDQAAENASKLSQAFGVQVDAFKLMNAESPDERIDMIRKSMKDAGVDAANFNRQQLKLLATSSGLDEKTAKLAFSMNNQGMSLDDIKKKSEEAEGSQLTQAEAMGKLADSIERLVKTGATQSGGFFDQFIKGFFIGIQHTKEFRTMIWNIKKALTVTMWEGRKLGKAFVEIFPGVKDFLGGLANFFNPGKFKEFFAGIRIEFEKFFVALKSGKFSLSELFQNLRKKFFNFFDKSESSGNGILKGFKDFITTMGKIIGQAIPMIAGYLAEGLTTIGEFLTDPSKFMKKAGKAGKSGAGFLMTVLDPIIKSLKKVHEDGKLKAGLITFVEGIGSVLKKVFASSTFQKVAKGVLLAMVGAIFAPAILKGALGLITAKVGSSALKLIGGIFAKKGAKELGGKAAAGGLGKLAGAAGPVAALLAAGVAIGGGVSKYTNKITGDMDRSTKSIAAGATGIIDALTLGLLPEDLMTKFANTFAQVAKMFFKAMEKSLGVGFVANLKQRMASSFEVLGSIYDLVGSLFSDDQASFDKAATGLGLSLLRFIASSFVFLSVQIPTLVGRLMSQVISLLARSLVKISLFGFGIVAKTIDSVFNIGLSKKVEEASSKIQKGIAASADRTSKELKKASDVIGVQSSKMTDKYLRTAEDQAKIASQATKSVGSAQQKAAGDVSAGVEKSLSSTLSDIKTVKEIKKELSGGENFGTLMEDIKKKLKGLDFKIIDDAQSVDLEISAKKINDITDSISAIGTKISSISDTFTTLAQLPKSVASFTNQLKSGGIKPAIVAVGDVVKLSNELEAMLSNGKLNRLDVPARMKALAKGVGLGSSGRYTIQNKAVNITVNFKVSMDVAEVEKVMILRKTSIVRDAIDFATNRAPDKSSTRRPFGPEATPANYTPGELQPKE